MKKRLVFVLSIFLCFYAFCEETNIKNLYQYKLDNGLMLFVAENHAVPLAYVEIAVKCGSFTQTPQTAGLFHLYEHIMFKGNSLYKDASSVQNALSKMGVAQWNGTTSLECVNYYFTIPSNKIEEGLKFWNSAIRFPLMDKTEFENEKKVVISEIQGNENNSSKIVSSAISKKLFNQAPWKMDPSGSVKNVENATIKQLKQIKDKYYIPNNSALFVGGDVNPEEVYKLVKKIYGSWKKGKNPFEKDNVPFGKLYNISYNVMPYEKISNDLAQITIDFRGSDAEFDREDTYKADVLTNVLSSPYSIYKQTIVNDPLLMVNDVDYVWSSYVTRRQCGVLSFGCIVVNSIQSLAERALYFYESLYPLLAQNITLLTVNDFIKVNQQIKDSSIFEKETAEKLLSVLRFWWICADADYYYNYLENIGKVSKQDLSTFIDKYVYNNKPVITVLVNPSVYEKTKQEFDSFNFEQITSENGFWWKDEKD